MDRKSAAGSKSAKKRRLILNYCFSSARQHDAHMQNLDYKLNTYKATREYSHMMFPDKKKKYGVAVYYSWMFVLSWEHT